MTSQPGSRNGVELGGYVFFQDGETIKCNPKGEPWRYIVGTECHDLLFRVLSTRSESRPPRQQVDAEHRICEHGRDAFADDCGMCELAGTNNAATQSVKDEGRPGPNREAAVAAPISATAPTDDGIKDALIAYEAAIYEDNSDEESIEPTRDALLAVLKRCRDAARSSSVATVSEEKLKEVLRPALGQIFDNLDDISMGDSLQLLVDALRDLEAPGSATGDSTRLDWLENTKAGITYFTPGVKWNGVVKLGAEVEWEAAPKDYRFSDGSTLREAIDKAMHATVDRRDA